jgi:anti-anti-sigma factor
LTFRGFKVIQTEESGDILIIHIDVDKININNYDTLRETLQSKTKKTSGTVILNLEKVSFIDSSGLGLIITFHRYLQSSKRELRLANCNDKVNAVIDVADITDVIGSYKSIDEALKG